MSEPNVADRIHGLRILVVDDEPDILDTIVDVLDGAAIERAGSYQEAIDLLDAQDPEGSVGKKYDVAILDIMGVSGMSLLTHTVERGIPTVMLTAHAMNPETLKESITKGALSYLPKEELANLPEHITDMFDAIEAGKSPWERLFDRLGNFFEKAFAPSWRSDDPQFWAYHYGQVM